jgi:uncharacterized protein (DUF305 family)
MRYWLVGVLVAAAQTATVSGQAGTAAGGVVEADVHFMQGMIHHHAQALRMVALIPDHSTRHDMQLLGQRIAISQRDEIRLMQSWLQDRGQMAPQLDAHDEVTMGAMQMSGMSPSDTLMPGMMTAEQMAQLAKAHGPEFDRLFLEGMIRHHEGALTMVDQLFRTPGAGQDPAVFRFASDVNADQRAEIARMQGMLNVTQEGKGHS